MSTVNVLKIKGLAAGQSVSFRTPGSSTVNMSRSMARASAHINTGTSPQTLKNGFNITSITDPGVGYSSPYFIAALNTSTYPVTCGVSGEVNSQHTPAWLAAINTAYTTVMSHSCNSGAFADKGWFGINVHGTLA